MHFIQTLHLIILSWYSLFSKNTKEKEFFKSLKQLLGFAPKNLELYHIATTHSSTNHDVGFNNERLELLGDSVFSIIITDFLYHKYPYKNEGELTEVRAKLVSRSMLNNLSIKLGLPALVHANLNASVLKSSSTPGNTLEALVGAIYLDRGIKKACRFIEQKILRVLVDLEVIEQTITNFKSIIINHAQKNRESIEFRVMKEDDEGIRKIFEIALFLQGQQIGSGSGPSKKKAEQAAAHEACLYLSLVEV